jgi:hypothetical protein
MRSVFFDFNWNSSGRNWTQSGATHLWPTHIGVSRNTPMKPAELPIEQPTVRVEPRTSASEQAAIGWASLGYGPTLSAIQVSTPLTRLFGELELDRPPRLLGRALPDGATSAIVNFTTSQRRSLLSMVRSNRARSRARVRFAHTCLGFDGGFCPSACPPGRFA